MLDLWRHVELASGLLDLGLVLLEQVQVDSLLRLAVVYFEQVSVIVVKIGQVETEVVSGLIVMVAPADIQQEWRNQSLRVSEMWLVSLD